MFQNKYFLLEQFNVNKVSLSIKQRKNRSNVLNLLNVFKFTVGDILVVTYWKDSINYRFEGICISIKKKSLSNPNVSIILRNIVMGVGMSLQFHIFIIAYIVYLY